MYWQQDCVFLYYYYYYYYVLPLLLMPVYDDDYGMITDDYKKMQEAGVFKGNRVRKRKEGGGW